MAIFSVLPLSGHFLIADKVCRDVNTDSQNGGIKSISQK